MQGPKDDIIAAVYRVIQERKANPSESSYTASLMAKGVDKILKKIGEEATEVVLAFKPKKVYPYHYRTPNGFSDVAKFKTLVNTGNPAIEVVQLDWYPK